MGPKKKRKRKKKKKRTEGSNMEAFVLKHGPSCSHAGVVTCRCSYLCCLCMHSENAMLTLPPLQISEGNRPKQSVEASLAVLVFPDPGRPHSDKVAVRRNRVRQIPKWSQKCSRECSSSLSLVTACLSLNHGLQHREEIRMWHYGRKWWLGISPCVLIA